jgi:hypothetical protein
MRARFLALGVVLAWPSFAYANWFGDTIGRPITGGLAQGAHVFKDSMVTGAKQTRAAFGSAAHGVGIDRPRPNQEPGSDANAGSIRGEAQSNGPGRPACQKPGCLEGAPTVPRSTAGSVAPRS